MKRFLLGIIMVLCGCNQKEEETTKPIVQNITQSVYASGIVKSKDQYEVFSTVNGIISRRCWSPDQQKRKRNYYIYYIGSERKSAC